MPGYAISSGAGGLPVAIIDNDFATAEVCFYGAQVLNYHPKGERKVLWVSEKSHYSYGRAIRGGIPVCWPWFGAHPDLPGQPAHGYARIMAWPLIEAVDLPDGATRLGFALSPQAMAERIDFPDFDVKLFVSVGPVLEVRLEIANASTQTMHYTGALHSYFAVGDVAQASVRGLDGESYYDALSGEERLQSGDVAITGEVDRIYRDGRSHCEIVDPVWGRTIRIAKRGSASTVVWNPWIDKARRMADFGDEEYREMLCVETANAREDAVTLLPGGTAELAAIISTGKL